MDIIDTIKDLFCRHVWITRKNKRKESDVDAFVQCVKCNKVHGVGNQKPRERYDVKE